MNHIRDTGIGVGGAPRRGVPKTEEERRATHIREYGEEKLPPRGTGLNIRYRDGLMGKPTIIINMESGEAELGGIVVDEVKAKSTPCHGYRVTIDGKTSELVWSPGIVGALSESEKAKYCTLGITWGKAPEHLEKRWKILHEAGIKFKK